jgi:catalase
MAEAMQGVPADIVRRQVCHCYRDDPDYGTGLAGRMRPAGTDLPIGDATAAE